MGGRLQDKIVLITGAGGALGRAASLLFARERARVIANDVSEKAGRETVDAVRGEGGDAVFVRADVSRENEVRDLVARGAEAFGGLDVLYNNAGIFLQEDTSVTEIREETWDRVMNVNLKSQYLMCKYGVPHLLARGKGSVINVGSFVALLGCTVPQDAYTASKGGVVALTKSLAVQYGPRGIRANCICPGPVETPLMTSWLLTNPEARQVRIARIPLGRFGRPEDVAYLALYLASDESSWTTGSVFVVDGGITSNYF